MTWMTHQILALGAAFCLGLPPLALGAAWAGALLPDVIDQKRAALARRRQRAFNRIHRGTSHWFGWWLALWALGMSGVLPGPAAPAAAGLGFGALTHVILDACTPAGVPLAPVTPRGRHRARWSLGLCRTGGVGEYVLLAVAVALFWVLERHKLMSLARELPDFFGLC